MTRRLELPKFQAFDANGDPLSGGKVYTYEAGTSTPKTSYSDYDGSTANANPVVLDSRGEADIYVNGLYKIAVYTSADVLVWTLDNVYGVAEPIVTDYYQYPDSDASDQGVTGSSNTIKYAVDTISSSEGSIVLKHDSGSATTTYTLTTSESIPSNIRLIIEKGAILDGAGTLTLDNLGQIDAGSDQQIFGSSITVTATNGGTSYAEWWDVDGTADEIQINLALGCGADEVRLKGKTYTCNDEVTIPVDVNLVGVNPEVTILDFGSAAGTFSNSVCVYAAGGGLTEIGALNSNITKGTNTVSFASTPSAVYGDVVIIHDTDDSSYSGFRTYYEAGEYGIVEEVSGNDIELSVGTFSAYTADANTLVFKYNNSTSSQIKNIKVLGDENSANEAIAIYYGQNALVENCHIKSEQGQYGLGLIQCFNCRVKNVTSEIHSYIDGETTAYPIGIYNCQEITVDNCYAVSPWHAITIGGGTGNGKVVNRNIRVTNSTFLSNDTSSSVVAADFHGNTEHSIFKNCYCEGIAPSGNFISIVSCNIHIIDKDYALKIGEPSGFNYSIIGNTFVMDGDPATGRGVMIDMGGNSNDLTSDTAAGGVFEVFNNKAYYNVEDSANSFIKIENRGCTQTDLRIIVKDNEFIGNYSATGSYYALRTEVVSGAPFDFVKFENNYCYGCGVYIEGSLALSVKDNDLSKGALYGIRCLFGSVAAGTPGLWAISDNVVTGFQSGGIYAAGDTGQLITKLIVNDNVSVENSIADTGTTSFNSGLYANLVTDAYVNHNILGGTGAEQDQPAAYYNITTLYEARNRYFGTGSVDYDATVTTKYGNMQTLVANPTGGGTVDSEARTAINSILDILEAHELMKTS